MPVTCNIFLPGLSHPSGLTPRSPPFLLSDGTASLIYHFHTIQDFYCRGLYCVPPTSLPFSQHEHHAPVIHTGMEKTRVAKVRRNRLRLL